MTCTALIAGPAAEPLGLKPFGPVAWLLPTPIGVTARLLSAYLKAASARADYAERIRDEDARAPGHLLASQLTGFGRIGSIDCYPLDKRHKQRGGRPVIEREGARIDLIAVHCHYAAIMVLPAVWQVY
jgi:hypothetical protein